MSLTIEAGIAAIVVLLAVFFAFVYRPGRRDYNILLAIEAITVFAFIAIVLFDASKEVR